MKKHLFSSLAASVLVLGISTVGLGATINVPADRPTIQGAIDAAVDGDTVLVAPGIYVENIDFKGKAITVTSSSGPLVTTIDGSQPTIWNIGSVVLFKSGEGPGSVLDGFTITGGLAGTVTEDTHMGTGVVCGGGVLMWGSSATICNNIITGNQLNPFMYGLGFYALGIGVCCVGESPLGPAMIRDNVISANHPEWDDVANGGGVAVMEWGWQGQGSNPTIKNNIISGNSAWYGGGVFVPSGSPVISNNTIVENGAESGGGVFVWSDGITVVNSIIRGNTASNGPQLCVGDSYSGGSASAAVDYSDLQGGWSKVHVGPGCSVTWGAGNIDADPLFVDPQNGDYHLTWRSPCINRGTNDGASGTDLDGDVRIFMGSADMGADEFVDVHSLGADLFVVSELTGGTVRFTLNAGLASAGRPYLVLGSAAGTAPGILMPGGFETLPLNWDLLSLMTFTHANGPVFSKFAGTLGPSGNAAAQLNIPTLPGIAGLEMHYAYLLHGPSFDFASNPVRVEIVP